eukprot:CAMPEP_0196822242 /NCGR_PEP_ID=MMETSP1362-20130617/82704_1 /TAXON_ID=163516 /ORGANISM="Leptocylindrus danicus, Strain CCMP1856" /LENGTH=396 /DNA_ID=CAMNT_0042201743 /DNA_START=79 /DNA_END=1265 /DNA_ORIENTATION=-
MGISMLVIITVTAERQPLAFLTISFTRQTFKDAPRVFVSKNNIPSRRDLLCWSGLGAAAFPFFGNKKAAANAATSSTSIKPLADLPMQRLRLPKGGFGREYVIIRLMIQSKGPFDFMVDSGLTTELITPHLQNVLGVKSSGQKLNGLAAGGTNVGDVVDLIGASICCGEFANPGQTEFRLPTLTAVVSDFPMEHIDPSHDPVEGMIGMELLQYFDVDFDFPKGRLRLWKPGTADHDGLVEVPGAVLNESGLLGIRALSPGQPSNQPVVGIIDCGSAFSIVNWKAAELLGMPSRDNLDAYRGSPEIIGLGLDGGQIRMPTRSVPLTFCGDAVRDPQSGRVSFEPPPSNWKPWESVVAVGDLAVFSSLLGDGKSPYNGPAVLIGLDILSQRQVVLEAG